MLSSPGAAGALGYTKVLKSLEASIMFECGCGNEFSLSSRYPIADGDQINCKQCKRLAGMAPNIGERYVYKRVRSDAAKTNREFDLPFEWFKHTIHAQCHYCGSKDMNSISISSKRKGEYLIKNFRYNGIDRLNNDIGYVISNSVPCCFVCNRAKNSMGYQEFISWINNMVQYRSKT